MTEADRPGWAPRRLEMTEDVVIAGTGPAGLTAAIYLARAERAPLVIEGNLPGGQLTTTTVVENYPGFDEGVAGPDLMDAMRRQAARFGARFSPGVVDAAALARKPFVLRVGPETLECRTLVVATGASPGSLGLESERRLTGRGVSSCATCDAAFFKGKRVIVVGGGDTAMEEATFLTRFAARVYVVHRRDELRASKAMQKKAMADPRIEFVWNTVVADIHDAGRGVVTGVTLRSTRNNSAREMEIDGVFLAIGYVPNTGFLRGQIDMDGNGYIRCEANCCRTNVKGVFACGDVMDPKYRQVATSVGTGCRAAIDCDHYLSA